MKAGTDRDKTLSFKSCTVKSEMFLIVLATYRRNYLRHKLITALILFLLLWSMCQVSYDLCGGRLGL